VGIAIAFLNAEDVAEDRRFAASFARALGFPPDFVVVPPLGVFGFPDVPDADARGIIRNAIVRMTPYPRSSSSSRLRVSTSTNQSRRTRSSNRRFSNQIQIDRSFVRPFRRSVEGCARIRIPRSSPLVRFVAFDDRRRLFAITRAVYDGM
jgi:hypothetical protein